MSGIVIIGGGFAGVWSAAAAARVRGDADLNITLVAPADDMVLRPRLHRLLPEWSRVPLKRSLEPIGVAHLRAAVTEIDTEAHRVVADDRALTYDRLVMAAGSRLSRPAIPGSDLLFDIDTVEGAARLAARLHGLDGFRAVVVGSGFTGLEIATELAERGEVVLVERADAVGPDLGPGPRPVIEAALTALDVEVRLGTTLTAVDETGAHLLDGTRLPADVVIWTGGMRASQLTAQIPAERDPLGR
ncbi:NAD(P)/FAD-dependent oxidoreductase [Actinomadura viridis]|uniref:NAD(P)/FAD-dependent oxidoreductase n=1 Tax=Actinomadura viridis TaxID=58110 RepID=UPI00367B3C9F